MRMFRITTVDCFTSLIDHEKAHMVNPQQQARVWDHITEHPAAIDDALHLIEAILPKDALRGKDALDAGCGAGDYTAALDRAGVRSVQSFDVSVGRMSLAAAKTNDPHFLQASLTDLPYPSASFDVIWVWGILHYVPDAHKGLQEIARVLRPGGVVVIHTSRRGFWSWLEINGGHALRSLPDGLQNALLTIGKVIITVSARIMSGKPPADQTAKSVRQKLQERLFVPGNIGMFSVDELARGLGSSVETHEFKAPVTDLLRRNMTMTIIGHKK